MPKLKVSVWTHSKGAVIPCEPIRVGNPSPFVAEDFGGGQIDREDHGDPS